MKEHGEVELERVELERVELERVDEQRVDEERVDEQRVDEERLYFYNSFMFLENQHSISLVISRQVISLANFHFIVFSFLIIQNGFWSLLLRLFKNSSLQTKRPYVPKIRHSTRNL